MESNTNLKTILTEFIDYTSNRHGQCKKPCFNIISDNIKPNILYLIRRPLHYGNSGKHYAIQKYVMFNGIIYSSEEEARKHHQIKYIKGLIQPTTDSPEVREYEPNKEQEFEIDIFGWCSTAKCR